MPDAAVLKASTTSDSAVFGPDGGAIVQDYGPVGWLADDDGGIPGNDDEIPRPTTIWRVQDVEDKNPRAKLR